MSSYFVEENIEITLVYNSTDIDTMIEAMNTKERIETCGAITYKTKVYKVSKCTVITRDTTTELNILIDIGGDLDGIKNTFSI